MSKIVLRSGKKTAKMQVC